LEKRLKDKSYKYKRLRWIGIVTIVFLSLVTTVVEFAEEESFYHNEKDFEWLYWLDLVCIGVLTLLLAFSLFILILANFTMDKIDAANGTKSAGRTIFLNICAASLQMLAILFEGVSKMTTQVYGKTGRITF
jgi:hypothetical protein